ncbi:MAG: hypothetical protein KF685_08680 [Acidobacteria bacterium]|nr:hypothetical protein [Acidobacteriota bacterium]
MSACLPTEPREPGKPNHGCEKWKRISLEGVAVCLPKDFAVENVKSIDGKVIGYKNDELRFTIDYNIDAYLPGPIRHLPTYKEEVITKGSNRYWIWSVEDRFGWKYANGMNVWDDDLNSYIAGVYLETNSTEYNVIAEKIFQSACYEPKTRPSSLKSGGASN